MTALGLLVLRVTLGTILVAHGANQLFGAFAGPGVGPGGLSHTAAYFTSLGVSHGLASAVAAGVLQLIGGACLIVGLLARWMSVLLIGYFGVEIWKDQARWGLFLNWMLDQTRGHGYEYSVVMAGALLCLVLAGAGDWSIDGWRAGRAAARAAGRARLRRQ